VEKMIPSQYDGFPYPEHRKELHKLLKEHRITSRSTVVSKWFDNANKEWAEYTCGVTGHNCGKTIKIKPGKRR
jgi:NADPH-dependent curcumin reductase CurA